MSENSKWRILFVSEKCGFYGGVERYIHDTAEVLRNNGFSVSGLFSEAARDQEDFSVPFEHIFKPEDVDGIENNSFDLAFIHKVNDFRLIHQVRKKFPTAVFVHDHDYYCLRKHKYFPFCRVNCSLPQNRIYCPVCTFFVERKPNGKLGMIDFRKRFLVSRQIWQCSRFIVMSDFMQNNLLMNGIPRSSISKLYPVRQLLPGACPAPDSPPVIFFCGQLIKGKGCDLLVKALTRVRSDFRAWIVGSGSDEPHLRSLTEKYALQNRVEFKGWAPDPGKLLHQATVAVVPSRWQEPFGLTGIEAMAAGVPVVGFDVGGITEWLKNGINGIAVKAGDITAFASAIDKLLANPEMARSYGESGQRMVADRYSEQAFIGGFSEILEKIRTE